jgi:glycosyltransferase involved in cell wall biosynthesis
MRIAVVNNFFPPRVGGSSHLSDALARGYAAAGHDVLVLTAAYRDAPARETRDGLRIVRLPSWTLPQTRFSIAFDISFTSRPTLPRRLRRVLDDFAPDVIHQHGQFFDLTWATGVWARRRKVPTLLSVHTRLENPYALYSRVFRALDRVLVWPFLRAHRPRIVVMDALMDAYIRDRYAGAYSGLEYIPVGVDPRWVRGGDAAVVRARHNLGDAPVILSVGHVIPLRDRVALVEAMPAVLAEFPDARLLVVGGVYYDHFLTRARELGVADAVISVGARPKTDIPHYLAAATVECHEQGFGLGTASLEAMASGVPVIAPVRSDNFPGIQLVDGGNVFLTDRDRPASLAERLVAALRDPESTRTVAKAGQELIDRHFALDRVVDRHLAVLHDLTSAARDR